MKKVALILVLPLLIVFPLFARITPPPTGTVTLDPEWAEREGIIMRYPWYPFLWNWFLKPIFAEMVDNLQDRGIVYIFVANAGDEANCRNDLISQGIPLENIEFIHGPTEPNGEWVRDFGPWFVWVDDSTLSIVDMKYYLSEPVNDYFPEYLERYWWMDYYGPDIKTEGGNMMTDGHGNMMMTSVIFTRNPGMTAEEVNQIYRDYFGQDTVYIFETMEGDILGHIDGWAKIVNDTTIIVARLPEHDPNYELIEEHAVTIAQIPTVYGTTFNVIRIQLPDPWWYTYLNGLLFNGLCLVPIYGLPEDQQALAAYEQALGPNWEVVGINCYWTAQLGGAVHCLTMGVPRHDWDYQVEVELTLEPVNPPIIIPPGGGSFDFTVDIENLESDSILFDVWIDVTLPDSSTFGPIIKRERVILDVMEILSREVTQAVPGNAPPGNYTFNLYVGSCLPLVISTQSSFQFEKLSGAADR